MRIAEVFFIEIPAMHIVLRESVIEPRMQVKKKSPVLSQPGFSSEYGTFKSKRYYCTDTAPKFCRPNGLT